MPLGFNNKEVINKHEERNFNGLIGNGRTTGEWKLQTSIGKRERKSRPKLPTLLEMTNFFCAALPFSFKLKHV